MGYIEVQAVLNQEPRGIPMHSLHGDDEQQSQLAADLVFLKEIMRQAEIFNLSFQRAWTRGINTKTSMHDLQVLADIQSALFASIIIRRILSPEAVRKHPKHASAKATRNYALDRASRLKKHLHLSDDHPILTVAGVRDSYEHIDERIDALTISGAASITDWVISDGLGFSTIPNKERVHHRLRVFYPGGGVLFYDDQLIDLYALDIELMALRKEASPPVLALLTLEAMSGSWLMGSSVAVHLIPPETVPERYEEWLRCRRKLGESVDYRGGLYMPTSGNAETAPTDGQ